MPKHIVILLHGIRTQGEWAQRAASVIESDGTMVARPIRYGFFDVLRFILPIQSIRDKPINRVTRLVRDELSKKPKQVSVIAHSFGSYLISKIIEREPDIRLARLIVCGSIVREDFEWQKYGHRIGSATADWQLICDCGMRDIWPVLAHTISWGYGASGRFGFGHPRVKDRYFNCGHSDFFAVEFIKSYWMPYLSTGEIVPGEAERPTTPWLISVTNVIQLKWILIFVLAACLGLQATQFVQQDDRKSTGSTALYLDEIGAEEAELASAQTSETAAAYLAHLSISGKPVQMVSIQMWLVFDRNGDLIPHSSATLMRFYDDPKNPIGVDPGPAAGCTPSGRMLNKHVLVFYEGGKCSITITGEIVGGNFEGRVEYGYATLLGEFKASAWQSLQVDMKQ